jgi:hypothetical protein
MLFLMHLLWSIKLLMSLLYGHDVSIFCWLVVQWCVSSYWFAQVRTSAQPTNLQVNIRCNWPGWRTCQLFVRILHLSLRRKNYSTYQRLPTESGTTKISRNKPVALQCIIYSLQICWLKCREILYIGLEISLWVITTFLGAVMSQGNAWLQVTEHYLLGNAALALAAVTSW